MGEKEKEKDKKLSAIISTYMVAAIFSTAHTALDKGWLTKEQTYSLINDEELVNSIMSGAMAILTDKDFNEYLDNQENDKK